MNKNIDKSKREYIKLFTTLTAAGFSLAQINEILQPTKALEINKDYIDFNQLASNPSIAKGRLAFVGSNLIFSPDGLAFKNVHPTNWEDILNKPSSFPPSAHASSHISGGADALSGIAISQLEYPTVNVSFGYLFIIGKAIPSFGGDHAGIITTDAFTDKAGEYMFNDGGGIYSRYTDDNNTYRACLSASATTQDFWIAKYVGGTGTGLGYEAVDLVAQDFYTILFSISGSTLKGYRNNVLKITATDTSFTSGKIRCSYWKSTTYTKLPPTIGYLKAPSSALPAPSAIVEYDVIGTGKENDPIRPDMPQNLVEVNQTQVTPEEWMAIQTNPKGANGLPLVDTLATTWGAIDYKGESTMICALYSGSPSYLDPNRIQRHINDARSKNLKVFTPPYNYRAIHAQLKAERRDMLITENELRYQIEGAEALEPQAVYDFYDREVNNLRRIDPAKIVDFDYTMELWAKRAEMHGNSNLANNFRRMKKK